MNYAFSSFFAVAIAFFSFNTATAATVADMDVNTTMTVEMDMSANAADGSITLDALVQLPNGSTSRKTEVYRNMEAAVDGYVKFVTTLPYGATLIRIQFTNARGQVVFAVQG